MNIRKSHLLTSVAVTITLLGASAAQAGWQNGRDLNGFSSNGLTVNGGGSNGNTVNGGGPNGLSTNGGGNNGLSTNGGGNNGLSTNGGGLNGNTVNGGGANGNTVNGSGSNGWYNGTALNSVASKGPAKQVQRADTQSPSPRYTAVKLPNGDIIFLR